MPFLLPSTLGLVLQVLPHLHAKERVVDMLHLLDLVLLRVCRKDSRRIEACSLREHGERRAVLLRTALSSSVKFLLQADFTFRELLFVYTLHHELLALTCNHFVESACRFAHTDALLGACSVCGERERDSWPLYGFRGRACSV